VPVKDTSDVPKKKKQKQKTQQQKKMTQQQKKDKAEEVLILFIHKYRCIRILKKISSCLSKIRVMSLRRMIRIQCEPLLFHNSHKRTGNTLPQIYCLGHQNKYVNRYDNDRRSLMKGPGSINASKERQEKSKRL